MPLKLQRDLTWLLSPDTGPRQGKNLSPSGYLHSLLNLATVGAEHCKNMISVQVYHVLKNIPLGGICCTVRRGAISHLAICTLEFKCYFNKDILLYMSQTINRK